MGRLLQVRVSAWTLDEKGVEKSWPTLARMVWDDCDMMDRVHGVVELSDSICTAVELEMIPKDAAAAMRDAAANVKAVRQQLAKALEQWKPQEANELSDKLEDALDALEDVAKAY